MKAEKSLGLAGCKLAAGSEVGITQTPVASFSSLKVDVSKDFIKVRKAYMGPQLQVIQFDKVYNLIKMTKLKNIKAKDKGSDKVK